MSRADERHDISVEQYISSIEDVAVQNDARALHNIMHRISGEQAILYGIGTIGYGVYHYEYDSGRKGESHILGFYPRKGKITIYLTDGTDRYAQLLSQLGKHTLTGYCLYIKKLTNIELPILEQILERSYSNVIEHSKNGPITQIFWQKKE